MRSIIKRAVFGTLIGVLFCALGPRSSLAAYYNYQAYDGNGVLGAIGSGTLRMSNTTTTVYAGFKKGMGSFSDVMVIFVDSIPGGFTSTRQFSDKDTFLQSAISGYRISRSVADFAPGFEADYAIALSVDNGSAVFKLISDDTGAHLQLVRQGLNLAPPGDPNTPSFTFQFDWADIGLPSLRTNFFKFESSYVSINGYRWLQTFEDLTGKEGYDFVTFTNYDTYGVQPVPENADIALAIFGGLAGAVVLIKKVRRRRAPDSVAGGFPAK